MVLSAGDAAAQACAKRELTELRERESAVSAPPSHAASPRSVSIYREEIWLEVKRENEAAANASAEFPELPEGFAPDA
jgi:hypothetical protein